MESGSGVRMGQEQQEGRGKAEGREETPWRLLVISQRGLIAWSEALRHTRRARAAGDVWAERWAVATELDKARQSVMPGGCHPKPSGANYIIGTLIQY